ncbi:zinc finger protein RFP-like isoform X6 [Paroedura picta]|uniref:zinc finger protein RFP-like isoform X6 n=1 Tax=Paroedura picta TaxID=143630 RepID=UPI004057BBE6
MSGMTAEQLLQQRLLRSRLRASAQHLGGGPPPQPLLPPQLASPSPPDSPPPGTTPAEIPAGPRYPSETWCSLCRVYCPEPVCLPCGHNFCTGCIGQRLGEPKLNISCLECGATARKRNLRPIKPPPLLSSLGVDRAKRQRLDSTGAVAGSLAAAAAAAPPVVPPPLAAAAAAAASVVAPPSVATAAAAAAATTSSSAAAAAATTTSAPAAAVAAAAAVTTTTAAAAAVTTIAAAATATTTAAAAAVVTTSAATAAAAAVTTTTAAAAPPLPLLSSTPTPPTPPTPKPPSPPPTPAPVRRPPAPVPRTPPPTSTGGAGDAREGRLCDKHHEVLQFFCEEDQIPICAHCDRSQEHRAHTIFHVERAARDYREQVQTQLENLKQEKNLLWNQKLSEEKKIQEYLDKAQAERQEIVSEFEHLRQFLKDQEQQLLARLEELDKAIEKRKEESLARFSEELSRLGELITEMEVKSKQPASEFLQDIKKLMSRCGSQLQLPEEDSPNLEERMGDFSRKSKALKKTLDRFQDHVIAAVEKAEIAKTVNDKDMNPDVSSVLLAMDQRSMGYQGPQHKLPALQYTPDTPKRFDSKALVLGCDGFTSGRYFWELEVGEGDFWALGVTRDPSGKKGMMNCSPEEGIWAVGLWNRQHWALTSPVTPLSLRNSPKRIRVSLDYVGECVTFIDGDTEDLIFTFPPASFNGTRTHPLLWVVGFPAQTVFLRRMGVRYPTGVHEMDILSP